MRPKTRSAAAIRQARYRERKKQAAALAEATDAALETGTLANTEGVRTHDLATALRDRLLSAIQTMSDEDLLNKNYAPAINAGLKAQTLLDKRAVVRKQGGDAQLAFAILQMLGQGQPQPLIEDGQTVEGTFEEVGEP